MFSIQRYSMVHSNRTSQLPSNMYKIYRKFDDYVLLAAKHIQLGNIIAIPTDTIYGLASSAQDTEAIQKLYRIKGREFCKPLSICVSSVHHVEKYAKIDHLPDNILNEFLPGPVTIILNRTENLNSHLNPSNEKVGVRIPKHNFIQQLTSRLNTPIALTSANKSNHLSSTSVDEFSLLWSQVDAVFDGGLTGNDKSGSTIIDLSVHGKYEIVREGCYLKESLSILNKFY